MFHTNSRALLTTPHSFFFAFFFNIFFHFWGTPPQRKDASEGVWEVKRVWEYCLGEERRYWNEEILKKKVKKVGPTVKWGPKSAGGAADPETPGTGVVKVGKCFFFIWKLSVAIVPVFYLYGYQIMWFYTVWITKQVYAHTSQIYVTNFEKERYSSMHFLT